MKPKLYKVRIERNIIQHGYVTVRAASMKEVKNYRDWILEYADNYSEEVLGLRDTEPDWLDDFKIDDIEEMPDWNIDEDVIHCSRCGQELEEVGVQFDLFKIVEEEFGGEH